MHADIVMPRISTFIHEPSLEDTAAFDSVQRSFSLHAEHYGENSVKVTCYSTVILRYLLTEGTVVQEARRRFHQHYEFRNVDRKSVV